MLGREAGFPFTSAPKFGNAVCYSESDMVALTTEHLIYIIPMNLGTVQTYDVIHKHERVTRDVGTTLDTVFPSVLPEEANKFSTHAFRHSAWSPRGGAPNGGCLLATVSTDSRVAVYRPPAVADNILSGQHWIEVADLYESLLAHCKKEEFTKGIISGEIPTQRGAKRKNDENTEKITGGEAIRRTHMVETLCLCWSPAFSPPDTSSSQSTRKPMDLFLALGGKSKVTLWKCRVPVKPPFTYKFNFSASISTDGQWVSAMSWKDNRIGIAFTDGSVRVWEVTKVHEDKPTINLITQVAPDLLYPIGTLWADDALWVAKGQSVIKINKSGKVIEKAEHTSLIKAMSLCSSSNQIITLTEDGLISGWDAKTCKRDWERESDFSRKNLGWHGIVTSPFGRYMMALEQISGVYDQMYKARNATGKFWIIPTGDMRPVAELILAQIERGNNESVWDILDLMSKERDPTLLFNITDTLEKYYYSRRGQKGAKVQISALCTANVLYEMATYVTETAMQDKIRENQQKNMTEIISKYIEKVFNNFKAAEKEGRDDFILQLSNQEILCLKNMYLWVETFAPELKTNPAVIAVEKHVSHTSIKEVCPFCKQPVTFSSHTSDKCSNGHLLLRCTRTFLALGSHVLWHNSFTGTKSLIFTFEREDIPPTKEFTWLNGGVTATSYPICPLYNIPFLRFPPSMLDKLDKATGK